MLSQSRRSKPSAITLVEVLLVVAVLTLVFQFALPSIQSALKAPRPGVQGEVRGTGNVTSENGRVFSALDYLLFLPADYGQDPQSWPLLVYLHGSGGRGSDLDLVRNSCGLPKMVEKDKSFPFIVVSPQCPAGQSWQPEQLVALVDDLINRYEIDPDRVYVTGFSMGGFGTWDVAQAYPERFAAMVPIAGGGDLSKAERLREVPCWAFHGAKDEGVSVEGIQAMVDAIRTAGGEIELTIYPNEGHGICTLTYENQSLYNWLLAQRRGIGRM